MNLFSNFLTCSWSWFSGKLADCSWTCKLKEWIFSPFVDIGCRHLSWIELSEICAVLKKVRIFLKRSNDAPKTSETRSVSNFKEESATSRHFSQFVSVGILVSGMQPVIADPQASRQSRRTFGVSLTRCREFAIHKLFCGLEKTSSPAIHKTGLSDKIT